MKYIFLSLTLLSFSALAQKEVKCGPGQRYDLRTYSCVSAASSGMVKTQKCALCKSGQDVIFEAGGRKPASVGNSQNVIGQ